MSRNRGFTLIELLMILFVLVLLAVVAVPRYIGIQKEVQAAAAQEFMCRLTGSLAVHIGEHYTQGTDWVRSGEELMRLLKEGPDMPEGMTYENGTWTVHGPGVSWRFKPAGDGSPPCILRVK